MHKFMEFICSINWGLVCTAWIVGYFYTRLNWKIVQLEEKVEVQKIHIQKLNEIFIEALFNGRRNG